MAKKAVLDTRILILILALGASLLAGGLIFAFTRSSAPSLQSLGTVNTKTEILQGDASKSETQDLLLYLIEEEKLAHDVYTKLGEIWGARVFSNIARSETTHQEEVLKLLQARDIADPRSENLGVFRNADLQALYGRLIAQGSLSITDAYRVGVIIEEKDITDISTQLETATDSDVITTLEKLRRASENHLRAFNRQL